MKLLISLSRGRVVDKYRSEKMYNLMAQILDGQHIEIEGSPFVDCANFVAEQNDMSLYFVLLGEDSAPLSPSRCIVIDDTEEIVFDPDENFRSDRRRSITEPMYYQIDETDKRRNKEVPYYIVSRRQAREIIQ